ncbi:zinc finger protein [Fragilaria crotonensis]|nr:zinc finger protein [Fragilaria crotonensis]
MIPVTSTVHTRRSDADLRVRVMPFAARPSPAQGANNSAPPGFTTNTSTTWTFSPELSKVWLNGDVFVPSLVPEGYKVSPRHTFVPLVGCQSDTKSFFYFVEPSRHIDDETPPTSPSETKKLSPTHTVQTMTTVDSYLSSRSITTTPDANRKSFPYLPMRSREGDQELSSLQRARWVPPRSIDVCRVLNDSDRDSPSSLSGLSGSYSARSLNSPQCRKKAILSPPRVEHDPIRKSRIKTEMCLHFINKTSCPFGANCTYAHGEEELQLTRLMDLHEAGLVDATTYRTVPCLTFVSTGSCPFGKRCHGIHDPRVAGIVQSWLPHTETQGNTIATDINVDALHQKRLYSLLYNNPFGALFIPGETSFDELYDAVCNANSQYGQKKQKKGIAILDEHHRVSIALQMRGGSNFQFKFRPQHIVYDELCMVLQKRVFRLTNDEAVEIPFNMYNVRSTKDVLVREIAFGPDWDSTVRGVGLWFEISESDVTVCTPQQAKRFRWKRGVNNKKQGRDDTTGLCSVASKFDDRESFDMIRPSEHDAYMMATNMLVHHLNVLRANRISNMCERAIALEGLATKRKSVETCFDGLVRAWKNWTWLVNEGRDKVDDSSVVPFVDACYKPISKDVDSNVLTVNKVWESFASVGHLILGGPVDEKTEEVALSAANLDESKASRLSVFKRLAEGSSFPGSKSLPHITDSDDGFEVTGSNALQGRRCWKSLLLKPSSCNEYNEWDVVSGHFQNSRSRKVLTILQSQ